MRLKLLVIVLMAFALSACDDKPTAPDSPNPSTYGKSIEPDHNIPEEDYESHKRDLRGGTVEMDHNIPEEDRESYERDVYAE